MCLPIQKTWRFDPWISKILWRGKWRPTPVFLPGKSHGQRNLVGYSSWDRRVGHDWATSLIIFFWTSLVAQRVKHLPVMQETWVQSLGQEDPLEQEMATHSCILAWEIPWQEEPRGLQSMGLQRVGHDWAYTYVSLVWYNNMTVYIDWVFSVKYGRKIYILRAGLVLSSGGTNSVC